MNLLHQELTEAIIGAGISVLNELKPGLDEKLYENALVLELQECGILCSQQKRFDVHYKGVLIGTLIPDLIVGDQVVVDTKVVESFNDSHLAQMIGYLAITDLKVGVLINFKHARLVWKRVVR